ncbi:MAG: FAD:protein FMN transferase, partial [Candidatus Glassbacteria bacterium]|nr:FAD:protein FMN transferase [Candidatus Glassbacteria bacterium]
LVCDEVARVNAVFDPWNPESELNRLNASRGGREAVPLSRDMSVVLAAALRIGRLSDSLFDPALGDLVRLWGFNDQSTGARLPDSLEIRALLDSSDLSAGIVLVDSGRAARLGGRTGRLEMGGIAKGYAVDRAIAVLRDAGVGNALVNLGGEIGVLGAGSNGKSWRVGVQHPRSGSSHLGVLELTDGMFVATSGDYENYFFAGGRRYHHILDPRTGYPAFEGVVSASVVGAECLEADAVATTLVLLGPGRGLELMEEQGLCGLIVYRVDSQSESSPLAYRATGSFLRFMTPDLDGIPIP